MPGHKAVILHLNPAILIIEGRTVEGIAHHLAPMLPSGQNVVIIIIVNTTYMGSVSQMMGSTGLMREDITFIFLCRGDDSVFLPVYEITPRFSSSSM